MQLHMMRSNWALYATRPLSVIAVFSVMLYSIYTGYLRVCHSKWSFFSLFLLELFLASSSRLIVHTVQIYWYIVTCLTYCELTIYISVWKICITETDKNNTVMIRSPLSFPGCLGNPDVVGRSGGYLYHFLQTLPQIIPLN